MTSSPSAARLLLGTELRRLREEADLLVEDAARILECSTAKISRLENGKGRLYLRDVRDLLLAYGPSAASRLEEFQELVEAGNRTDWTDKFRDVSQAEEFSDHLALDRGGRFVTLERDATELKWYEPDYIPGLLQTPEYIDAIQRKTRPSGPRTRFVEFRLQRQQAVLSRPSPPAIISIISELAIIRRGIVERTVMRKQLKHLLDVLQGRLEWIDFRITSLATEPTDALGGPFMIMKFADSALKNTVYLEGREEPDYLDAAADVERYEERLDNLLHSSPSREQSLNRLSAEIRAISEELLPE